MALRNLFKFRDLPESETSKPFLEHLEDLRWTIVKMAITLLAAMVLCFFFRTALVHVMQRPLREVDPAIGALRALAITDSFTISFRLARAAQGQPKSDEPSTPVDPSQPRHVILRPEPANVSIAVDGAEPRDFGPSFRELNLVPGAHSFRFKGAHDCCVDHEMSVRIPAGSPAHADGEVITASGTQFDFEVFPGRLQILSA